MEEKPTREASSSDYETLWRSWDDFFAALNQARGREQARSKGLTVPQYRLLALVDEFPASRSGELAARMGVSAPTTTRMLSGLERAGIARRNAVPEDRRGRAIELTAKGRGLFEQKQAIISQKRRALYDSLTPSERRETQRLLGRLAEAIDAL